MNCDALRPYVRECGRLDAKVLTIPNGVDRDRWSPRGRGPALREAVVLKYALGLGNDEIAEILGASREAVWTRLSRARKELRRRIHGDL